MNENYTVPELDISDAEIVLNDVVPGLHNFFVTHRSRQLSYTITDANDEPVQVGITAADLETSIPEYMVTTEDEQFRIDVAHSVDDILDPQSDSRSTISVRRYSPDDKFFLQPSEKDTIRVAQLLNRIDIDEVERDVKAATHRRKLAAGRRLFGRMIR